MSITGQSLAQTLTIASGVLVSEADVNVYSSFTVDGVARMGGYAVAVENRPEAFALMRAILAAFEADPESGMPTVEMDGHGIIVRFSR